RSVPFFTRKPLLETVKGFFRLDTSVLPCTNYCISLLPRPALFYNLHGSVAVWRIAVPELSYPRFLCIARSIIGHIWYAVTP
ncbi:MAG: hypothetical protein ACN6O7_12835, partial [Sphingobacterium sp.]